MLRRSIVRSASVLARPHISYSSKPPVVQSIRFETTKTPAFKAAQELNDDLQRDWDAKVLTYEELKPKTSSPTPDTYLVDVREPDEVIQGMIPSAVNLPLSTLANSLYLHHSAFKEKHGFDKPQRDQELIFYCRSGKRSASASDIAKRNGYTNILNYKGSWLDWVERENKP